MSSPPQDPENRSCFALCRTPTPTVRALFGSPLGAPEAGSLFVHRHLLVISHSFSSQSVSKRALMRGITGMLVEPKAI